MRPYDWHAREFGRVAGARERLPHALLLRGPLGIGKLAFARALAQLLLCETPAGDPPTACGACSGCTWFSADAHPDYRQIEPATQAGSDVEEGERKATSIVVEQVRALAEFINVSSHRGGAKVVVIRPADALNVNAANALLKSLEEPPPRTYFVLVADRPHLLLPTIRSRCQHIPLQAPDADTAGRWLASEGVRNPALALAHMGNAPLLALELNGTDYWAVRAAFLRHLAADEIDIFAAGEAARDFAVAHVIVWLQKWSYDMALYAIEGHVRYNPDFEAAIARAAAAADRLAVLRFHREMVKLQRVAQHPLNARLFIEHVLLAYRDAVRPQRLAA